MDHYSILDDSSSQAGLEPAALDLVRSGLASPDFASSDQVSTGPVSSNPSPSSLHSPKHPPKVEATASRSALRFPGEDGGKSLSEMAQRDLDATLQLLAERAQYITGASGAAIALLQGESMVCCASAGPSAPELGAHLQIDSGLSAESVRTRKILICEDAENDPRVNRDSCRTFGIASVVVMPLVRGEEVYGVFELLSGRPRAFEERDFVALNRLADMIQTAVEYADGARRAEEEFGQREIAAAIATLAPVEPATETHHVILEAVPDTTPEIRTRAASTFEQALTRPDDPVRALAASTSINEVVESVPNVAGDRGEMESSDSGTTIAFGNLRRCETCGFPVSEGRRLCLDCEAANPSAGQDSSSQPFAELGDSNTSWVGSHGYLIAAALVAAATIALLIWRL